MKKLEFLQEIENNLEGRISYTEIKTIMDDYDKKFVAGATDGKDEETISEELGSPAKISRRIMEDLVMDNISRTKKMGSDIEKKFVDSADKLYEKVIHVDERINKANLASMGKRTGAYLIDSVLLGIIGLFVIFSVQGLFSGATGFNYDNYFSSFFITFIPFILLLGLFNIVAGVIAWITNGYTPGKWMLSIRIVKIDGSKLTFMDAFLRELIIKSLLNALVSGFLNIGSFIWGCISDDHKTVHDLCVKTTVVIVAPKEK